jgi:tetratricopeptide (TPR) repeat protein
MQPTIADQPNPDRATSGAPRSILPGVDLSRLQSPRPLWVALGLCALTLFAFLPCLRNGFVNFDDPGYVYANPHTTGGLTWRNILWAFTTLYQGFWHPLTWLSIQLDCTLYGLRPWGHHLTSVLLHTANTALLFLALRRLTGATWRSAAVAAFFAVHPLHVESVAWAAERKDVLSTFFLLLALWAYARNDECRMTNDESSIQHPASSIEHRASSIQYPVSSIVFFTLALMCKTMAVTFPVLLLLVDWWPLNRLRSAGIPARQLLREKIPFFALACVFGIITIIAQRQLGALQPIEQFPLGHRFANALLAYVYYLEETLLPIRLSVFYPFPAAFSVTAVLIAVVALAAITLAAVWRRRSFPPLLFGWAWYLLMLAPVIGILQVGSQSHADRYTYLPLVGVFVLVVWGVAALAGKREALAWPIGVVTALALTLALVLCVVLTRNQIGYWRSSETLFVHALKMNPANELAYNNLAAAAAEQGRLGEAIFFLRQAVRLNPRHALAQANLGIGLVKQGRVDEAMVPLTEAIRLKPDYALAHAYLGSALFVKGRVDEARKHLQRAVDLAPGYPAAHRDLGALLGAKGDIPGALVQLRIAVQLAPDDAEAHYNLGIGLAATGKTAEAIAQYQEAIRLNPRHSNAHVNLGAALGSQGNLDGAIQEFKQALAIDPNNRNAADNLRAAQGMKKP